MNQQKKNLLSAFLIGAVAVGIYVFAIFHVMSGASNP